MQPSRIALDFCRGDKWGYLGIDGSVLLEPCFESTHTIKDGLGHATQGSSLVILDDSFEPLGVTEYASSFVDFHSGLLQVEDTESDLEYYIDVHGRNVFNKKFDSAFSFGGDRAMAKRGDKWGMLDLNGRWVVEPVFRAAVSFQDDADITSVRRIDSHSWQLMDRNGQTVCPRDFDLLRRVREGLVPFGRKQKNGAMRFGVLDQMGREIVPPIYHECDAGYCEGLLGVEVEDGSWGVIDTVGRWVIEPSFNYIGECRGGLLLAYQGGGRDLDRSLRDGKFGFVNPAGETKIVFQFDEALPFEDGVAHVDWYTSITDDRIDMEWGYVSSEGRIIWRVGQR